MTLAGENGSILLRVAREAIDFGLTNERPPKVDVTQYPESLREQAASFVTLKLQGKLRGCMGALNARQALISDVCEHAHMAAFRDPRFAKVTKMEARHLHVSVSVLSVHEPVEFTAEQELIEQLRPNVDGLILSLGEQRATFLPSVWETLPQPAMFLSQLKKKAGFGTCTSGYRVWRYTTESIETSRP